MSKMAVPENMTWGHVCGFIYLTFTHSTDGDFSKEEYHTCVDCINSWTKENNGADIMDEVLTWYNSVPQDWAYEDRRNARIECMLNCANMLKEGFNEKQIDYVLEDVDRLIKADGEVLGVESKWLEMLTKQLKG